MATSNVQVRVDATQAVQALQQVNRASGQADTATQKLTNSVTRSGGAMDGMSRQARNASTSVAGLGGALRNLAVAASVVQAARFVFAKTAELETQTRSIQTLTGSVEQAKQIIQELQQLGAVTPFTSAELIETAKRLSAFGVAGNEVVEITRQLGDVAGATSANLNELALVYGQVQAKGRLQGEELLQFQERGVALQAELQKMYGLTGEEFSKALSKGQISAEAVEVAIKRLTDAGGKYANGAIAQSDTLAGRFSTLQDGIESIARRIGEELKPILKDVLNLAIGVVDAINNALAGPEYKTANDRLYNTRARIKELQAIIKAGEKAGLGMQSGAPILGVDGQVLGGGAPALSAARFELQQQQKQAKFLESRLRQLRQKPPAPSTDTKPPPLLGGGGAGRSRTGGGRAGSGGRSMEDLLGGVIQQRLEENKALLQTRKINALNAVALSANAEQAKRMVDFAYEYQDTQLEIKALQETLAAREQYRDQIIAQSKNKEDTRLALLQKESDIRSAINVRQEELNTIFARHQEQIISASAAEQQRLEQQTKAGQDRMQQLADEAELLQARLDGNEAEVMLRQQIRDIVNGTAGIEKQDVENQLKKIRALQQQLTAQEQIRSVYEDIGASIKSGVVDAIQSAVDGTKTLGQVASDVLRNIANKLLDVAVNMALFGVMSGTGTGGGLLGGLFKARAMGGSVTGGQPYLVGEKGPELFMPGRSGGIAPTGSFGGGVSVVVNVDASGTSVSGNEPDAAQLGRAVSVAVQAEIIKQQRPGGLLSTTRR